MLDSIKRMLEAFENNNIQYCHWKSNEHLNQSLTGDTDLDMLFLPEQRNEIDKILNSCGLKRFRSTPLMQYNAIEDYIGFDYEKAKIWHLHTHYRMTLGEKHLKGYTVTPWGYKIIKNRILDKTGIYTSCPEDELILLLSRIALKLRWRDYGKKLEKEDIAEIKYLIERIDYNKLEQHSDSFFEKNSKKEFVSLIKADLNNKNQFINFKKILIEELSGFTGNSYFSSFYLKLLREIYWLYGAVIRHIGLKTNVPNRRISPSGGCVISFLGCDGAGKTTTINYVKKELTKKLDVKIIYFGSGDGECAWYRKPMKFIAKLVGGKGVGHKIESDYSNKNKLSIKSKLYLFAKILWAIALAFEKRNKLKDMTKARNAGMIVITDRYPQSRIMGISDGPLLTKYLKCNNSFLRNIAEKEFEIYKSASINPPDLFIKLMIPTAHAISRKPEMTIEEIEKKKEAVNEMNFANKSVVIDTSVDFENSISNVMSEIWKII